MKIASVTLSVLAWVAVAVALVAPGPGVVMAAVFAAASLLWGSSAGATGVWVLSFFPSCFLGFWMALIGLLVGRSKPTAGAVVSGLSALFALNAAAFALLAAAQQHSR